MRPPLEERLLRLGEHIATWSTCWVKHGAVIARGNRIISMGYNGSKPGEEHCIDVGCLLERGHCRRTIHSEVNAINWAKACGLGHLLEGAEAYVTGSPCPDCARALAEAGIKKVIYRCAYRGYVPDVPGVEWIEWGWGSYGKQRNE